MQLRDVTTKSVKPEHAIRVDRTQTNDTIFASLFASARAQSSQRGAAHTAHPSRHDRIESTPQEQHHKPLKEDAQPDGLSDRTERTRPADETSRQADRVDQVREDQSHDKTSDPVSESSTESTRNEIDRPADQNSNPSDSQDNESVDTPDQDDAAENTKENSLLSALATGVIVATNNTADTNTNANSTTTETQPLQAGANPTAHPAATETTQQPQQTQNNNLASLLDTAAAQADPDTQAPKVQTPHTPPVTAQQTTPSRTQVQIAAADTAAATAAASKNEAAGLVASNATDGAGLAEVSILPAEHDTKTQPQALTQSADPADTSTKPQPAPQPIVATTLESTDADTRHQSGLGQQRHQDTTRTTHAQTVTQTDAAVTDQAATTGEQKPTARTDQSQNLDPALAANSRLGQTHTLQNDTRSNPASVAPTAQADTDRLQAQQNTEEIVKAVRAAYSRGESRLQMRLDPPELGALRVEIRQNSNGLTIQLQATSSKAHELLQQTRQDLQAALEASGISPRGIDIQLRLDLRNDPNTQHQNNQPQDFNQNNPNQQQGRPQNQQHTNPNPDPHPWQPESDADTANAQPTQTVNPGWQQLSFAGLDLSA